MSKILKRQVIKNVFHYSGRMFSTKASDKFQALCSELSGSFLHQDNNRHHNFAAMSHCHVTL